MKNRMNYQVDLEPPDSNQPFRLGRGNPIHSLDRALLQRILFTWELENPLLSACGRQTNGYSFSKSWSEQFPSPFCLMETKTKPRQVKGTSKLHCPTSNALYNATLVSYLKLFLERDTKRTSPSIH